MYYYMKCWTLLSWILVTSVCDQKDGIFIQSLHPVQAHLIAKLLNDIQCNLN